MMQSPSAMNRRHFVHLGILAAGTALIAGPARAATAGAATASVPAAETSVTLPPLPFAVAALEPHFARALCATAQVPYINVLTMLSTQTHQALTTYLQGMTRRALDLLARDKDIPLFTLPN